MSILFDLLLIAIIFISIVSGIKKGFVRSVMSFVSFIASFICAWQFTPLLAAFYNDSHIMSAVTGFVAEAIDKIIGGAQSAVTLDSLMTEKPTAFMEVIERYSTNIADLERFYNAQVATGAANISNSVSEFIAGPVAETISSVLAFLTIFLGVSIVLWIVSIILDAIFKLPPLSTFNRVGGFMIGAVCGLLCAWAAAMLLYAIMPSLMAVYPDIFGTSLFENSILLTIFYEFNPFTYMGITIG